MKTLVLTILLAGYLTGCVKNVPYATFGDNCKDFTLWYGSFWVAKLSDSSGVYRMLPCETYHKVWVPKIDFKTHRSMTLLELEYFYEKYDPDSSEHVDCYIFSFPHKLWDGKLKSWQFPAKIEVYKQDGNYWKRINKQTVKSIEELGDFKIATIWGAK